MIDLRGMTETAVNRVRRAKEAQVRRAKGRPGARDLPNTCHAYRSEEPRAVVTAGERDSLLLLTRACIMGLCADTVVLTVEGYHTSTMLDPRRDKPWEHGGMASYVEEFGLDHVVREGLFITAMTRAGVAQHAQLPYTVHGRTVEWHKDEYPPDLELEGYIIDTIREVFQRPNLDDEAALPEMPKLVPAEWDEETLRFHKDMGTLTMIQGLDLNDSRAGVMLFAKPGSKRHQLLRERLSPSQIIDPRAWLN